MRPNLIERFQLMFAETYGVAGPLSIIFRKFMS